MQEESGINSAESYLKSKVEKLHQQYEALAEFARQYLETSEAIKATEADIKALMDEAGIEKFNSALGEIGIVDKIKFNVPAERKEEMFAYFEARPELAPLVKTVKQVHYMTQQARFKMMYEDTNAVPEFVSVDTWQELKPKFKNFKDKQEYIKKIKSKQNKESASGDDAE